MNALAHSSLGASSMHRWSKCPGSVRQSALFPAPTTSPDAALGSDAHAYASFCLTRPTKAPKPEDIGKERHFDGRMFTPDENMFDAVAVYCAEVRRNLLPGAKIRIEERFNLEKVYPGCFGTADCVIWRPAEKLLIVMDYKHGAGGWVDVENNPQLQYYGLGALLSTGFPAMTVRLVIVQPRCGDPADAVRPWSIPAIDLIDFRADLIEYAKATEDPDAPLVPGDWCWFCPGRALCPGLIKQNNELARTEFSPALSYDPEALKRALDARKSIKAWLKGLDEFAYAEAEAGRCAPGYKLVAKKKGARKWRDEVRVIEHLKGLGVSNTDIFEPLSPKSPTKIEKLVGKKALAPVVDDDGNEWNPVIQESSGHVLAPESDKRPPVKLEAKDEFTAIAKGTDTNV